MNNLNFNYNEEIALESEPKGNYIKESGIYKGVITKAIIKESGRSGSQAIAVSFSFRSDEGQEANYLDLWIRTGKGEEFYLDKETGAPKTLPSLSLFMSILGNCNLKTVVAKQGKEHLGYSEFTNKKIALGLQKEEYEKNDGSVGYKFNIIRSFNYETMKTVSETKNGKEANIYKIEIKDKNIIPDNESVNNIQSNDDPDDILPF